MFRCRYGEPSKPHWRKFLHGVLRATYYNHCPPWIASRAFWKPYVDEVLEIIKKGQVQALTDHLNQVDTTNNIKFMHEEEKEGKIPFLDTLIIRKPSGTIKLLVYRKPTHTDQYLNFMSEHRLHQKWVK